MKRVEKIQNILCHAEHSHVRKRDRGKERETEKIEKRGEKRKHEVRGGTRQCRQGKVSLRLLEVAWIDRHGLCPSEMEKDEAECADGVEMAQRIE